MSAVKLPIEIVSDEWMKSPSEKLLAGQRRHAIFTVGVSASGKTTWATDFVKRNPRWWIISRDDLRANICVPFSWAAWKKFGSKGEKKVNELQQQEIDYCVAHDMNVIICDTNLSPKNFNHLVETFKKFDYDVHFKFFPVDWKTAVDRDNARANGVGLSVLAQQFEKLHAIQHEKERLLIKDSVYGKDAVLCDIDGTLAHMTTRGPYDYDHVMTDSLDLEIFDILNGLYRQGYEIVIVSGRDGVCKENTHNWLRNKLGSIDFYHYQRAEGDKRPDDVIKEELLYKIIEDGFSPRMVFDDRPRCFRMWRRLGLKVFQVGNPYIEF